MDNPFDNVRAQVVPEDALNKPALLPLDAVVEERCADKPGYYGEFRDDKIQPES